MHIFCRHRNDTQRDGIFAEARAAFRLRTIRCGRHREGAAATASCRAHRFGMTSRRSRFSQAFEQRGRQIALGEGGDDDDDGLARHLGPAPPTSIAAATAAPEEMPTGMPSSGRRSRAVSKAVWLPTVTTSSMTERSRMSGHEAGADALDLVRAGLAAGQHRRILGLDRDASAAPGLRAFSTWPTPVMVPPVPTPATKTSTPPLRVVPDLLGRGAAMDVRIGGILELLRDDGARRRRRRSPRPWRWRPACPAAAGRQHQFGAEQRQHLAPLDRHRFRHDQDQLVAARRRHEGERDAGVARGRLDQHALAGRDLARPPPARRSWRRRCGP